MTVAPRNSNIYLTVVAALIFIATMVIGVCAQDQSAPNEAERLMSVAKAAQEQGQYDDAIRAYRQVVVLSKDSPKNAALAYYNAGVLYLRFKNY